VFAHLSARRGPCGQGTVAVSAARSAEAAWWRPVGYTLAPRAAPVRRDAGLRLTAVTAGGETERRLLGVITVCRHRAGCGQPPDARYRAAVALRYTFLSQNALSACAVSGEQGRNRLIYESDGGMRVFLRVFEHLSARCGPISAARSAEAAWWRPVGYTLAPRARRCATRCGAAARDRDGGWRDQTAAPGCDYGMPTPCGVRAAA
jgi:hypothetical protein